ncbi:hypothetical protein [Novosphingobium sp. BW1]|uniref:hypothetical protein n=1 Tax=Novosphingobium sp. BW1 TaxID=2592621 RepID=UPI0011DEE7C3|nr:hypothetical protein [Novosphingobium sp. BW1]TYC85456.1 hypothetical protein FMM79_16580 [Novosphingobium sp. BW1]
MSARRLEGDSANSFEPLARDLTRKARRLAETTLAARRLASSDGDAPWRRADLVWPLFGKG